jgi:hypothetical protein
VSHHLCSGLGWVWAWGLAGDVLSSEETHTGISGLNLFVLDTRTHQQLQYCTSLIHEKRIHHQGPGGGGRNNHRRETYRFSCQRRNRILHQIGEESIGQQVRVPRVTQPFNIQHCRRPSAFSILCYDDHTSSQPLVRMHYAYSCDVAMPTRTSQVGKRSGVDVIIGTTVIFGRPRGKAWLLIAPVDRAGRGQSGPGPGRSTFIRKCRFIPPWALSTNAQAGSLLILFHVNLQAEKNGYSIV